MEPSEFVLEPEGTKVITYWHMHWQSFDSDLYENIYDKVHFTTYMYIHVHCVHMYIYETFDTVLIPFWVFSSL